MLFKPCGNVETVLSYKYRGWAVDIEKVGNNLGFSAHRTEQSDHTVERERFKTIKEIRTYVEGRIDEVMLSHTDSLSS